jgi:acyl-CoA thioesterase FadM
MIAKSIGSNGSDHARGRWKLAPALALARASCADTASMIVPDNGVCMDYFKVGREWLDYNDHMNVAFYLKAFDDASDRLTAVAGMGQAYTQATSNSWVALESHLSFQAEARLGDALRIESRVLEVDEKKMHVYQEMYRDDSLLSTHEQLGIHFNTQERRGCRFADEIYTNLSALVDAQRRLSRPDWIGRSLGIRRP